ncbi:MAG: hypothetical protein COB37_10435 [Kordiimonadales bacterium]|nr:MAG: hypothetical protein COB37_10435 [Kordiimonadales bacterium]
MSIFHRIALLLAALFVTASVHATAHANEVTTIKLSKAIHADGMAFNAQGELLTTSAWRGTTVDKINVESGAVSDFAKGLQGPIAIAINDKQEIFSTNWRGASIAQITADGKVKHFAYVGPKGDGLAFDNKGTLWFTAGKPGLLMTVSPEGRVRPVAQGGILKYPFGLAFTETGDLFISGGTTGEIYKLRKAGDLELFAQLPGEGKWLAGHLAYTEGRLFAAGGESNKIFEISMKGDVRVLAGSGAKGHEDGTGTEASFTFPLGLQLSPDAKYLYVVSGNGATDRLRKIKL